MYKPLHFLPLLPLLFVSCASIQERKNEAISQGVYATHDALKASRYDLAKSYSQELTKIVPAPAKRLRIAPEAPVTPKAAQTEAKQLQTYTAEVEGLQRATIEKANEKKQTLLGSIGQTWGALKFLTGFGGLAIALGLVALCVLVPGALPIVLNIAGVVWALFKRAGGFISTWTLRLLAWVRGKIQP